MQVPALFAAAFAVAFISSAPSAEAGFLKKSAGVLKRFATVSKESAKFNTVMLLNLPGQAKQGKHAVKVLAQHSKMINGFFAACVISPAGAQAAMAQKGPKLKRPK